MFKELLNDLKQSKCVLIGLGETFTVKNAEDELKYIQFYKNLKDKLGARDYYILTQAEDDLIFRCGFDKKHVAAPFVYPEDEEKMLLDDVQELIGKYNKIVDEKLKEKEEELMHV